VPRPPARIALVNRETREALRREVPVAMLALSDEVLARRLGFRFADWSVERELPDHAGLVSLVVVERASGARVAAQVVEARTLVGRRDEDILAGLGRDPGRHDLQRSSGAGAAPVFDLPAPIGVGAAYETSDVSELPEFDSLVVLSSGGLGDNLVALNVLRQLVEKLPRKCRIGFASRDVPSLYRCFHFVDEWISPAQSPETLLDAGWDLVVVLRYSAMLLWSHEQERARSYVPTLEGLNAGEFVGRHLPRTLGPLAFEWDETYLSGFLAMSSAGVMERARLRRALPKGSFIVFANGTDASFEQRLTKRVPRELLERIAARLREAGHEIVQVGIRGVEKIDAPGSVDLIGETSLEGLVEVLRRSSGIVCGDNGTMHLASQMDLERCRVCAIFGPTDPTFWGYPDNMNIVPAESVCPIVPCWFKESWWHLRCIAERRGLITETGGTPECMRSHDPNEIAEAVLRRIGPPDDAMRNKGAP